MWRAATTMTSISIVMAIAIVIGTVSAKFCGARSTGNSATGRAKARLIADRHAASFANADTNGTRDIERKTFVGLPVTIVINAISTKLVAPGGT